MDFKVVDQYEKYGRKIVIVHTNLDKREKQLVETNQFHKDFFKTHYCGYVSLKGNYYPDEEEVDCEYSAPGGITWIGPLEQYGIEGKFIGFDTAHPFMEDYTQEEAAKDCEDLAKQLNKKGKF